jgi:hypothetical protein
MRQSKSLNLKMGIAVITLGVLMGLGSGLALGVEKATRGDKTAGDEFFIISSVDMKSQQLVLKRPTEVTELMTVDAKTQILNEEGKPITLKNLRRATRFSSSLALRRTASELPLAFAKDP